MATGRLSFPWSKPQPRHADAGQPVRAGLGHRPDFGRLVSDDRIAVEVELAPKSKRRLDAILRLHREWLWDKKTNGIVYICGNEEGRRRIERANHRIDVMPG